MKFSLRFNNDLPVKDYIPLAQTAEEVGFDQFWVSNDLFLRSASVILPTLATATETIQLGSCIFNPYTIHPSELAMFSATMQELSEGRFLLGISSGAGDFLKWIGIQQKKPRTAVVESIQLIRKWLLQDWEETQNEIFQCEAEAYLRFSLSGQQVPIYIGAMSPKMLGEIGKIADGGLPLLFPPEHYRNVLPLIKAGAEEAGRKLSDIDIAACMWVSVSEDAASAEDVLKEKIAYYGHAMSPTILNNLGLTHSDFTDIEHAMQTENDVEKAKSLVTPQMMQIGIAGDAQALIERCEQLVGMGVNHLSFGPPLGPEPLEAIRVIGRDVIPHFRRI